MPQCPNLVGILMDFSGLVPQIRLTPGLGYRNPVCSCESKDVCACMFHQLVLYPIHSGHASEVKPSCWTLNAAGSSDRSQHSRRGSASDSCIKATRSTALGTYHIPVNYWQLLVTPNRIITVSLNEHLIFQPVSSHT